jgi:hypothetical protein
MKKLRQKRKGTETVTPSVGAELEKNRVYSAYKPVPQTDGIQTWTEHTHDFTAPWTKDDEAKFIEATERLGPYERIDDMQAMLATLPTDNPAISMHADVIRAIHAEVQAPPIGFTRERLAQLDQASEMWAKILLIRDVIPKARVGAKFTDGRKAGTGGPIRKAIAKVLKKNYGYKNPDLWAALSAKPPKGWTFFDNSQGQYIEGPNFAEDHMVYRRFCTVCGEERKKLRP